MKTIQVLRVTTVKNTGRNEQKPVFNQKVESLDSLFSVI